MDQFIQQLDALLHMAEQHGLSLFLLIGLLVALFFVAGWAGRKFDQMWKVFLDMKSTMPDPRNEDIEVMVNFNAEVKEILIEVLNELNADWCQLWQFHNGTYGLGKTKIPFMFLTMTNEYCRPDCQPMRTELTQLPLSMFETFANDLITEEMLIHQYCSASSSSSMMGKLMHNFGANIGFIRTIRDEDNKVIGFMTAAWKDSKTVTEKRKTIFMNGAQRMAALLAAISDDKEKNGKKA